MVLLFNLTVSYAQTGNVFIVNGDTLVGYNKSELQKIATRVVRSHECDTLLLLGELQLIQKNIALVAKDSALLAKDSVIFKKDNIITFNENIIIGKDAELERAYKGIKKLKRKLKLSKIGLYSFAVGAFLSILLLLTS